MKKSSLIGHTVELYQEILSSTKPPDHLSDLFFRARKYLGSKDRRFIAESVYGMLRKKRLLEWLIGNVPEEQRALYTCVAYLLVQNAETTENLIHDANIEESVVYSMSGKIGSHEFETAVNGSIGLKHSFPDWMVTEWEKEMAHDELEKLLTALNTQAPITIRVNTLKISVEECQRELKRENIETERTLLSPTGLHFQKRTNVFQLQSFQKGYFEVQDEGSQLLSLLVDPKPGSRVVDACAGAGGKSLAMGAGMRNTGEIFALDLHSRRLDDLRKRIKRSGIDMIRIRPMREGQGFPDLEQSADHVLVDAPCSGTGTIRRNPGMKWSVSPSMIDAMHAKQLSIVMFNARYVKPGGRLVYATCSLMRHENEDVVESFLASRHDFERVSPSPILERNNLANVTDNEYFKLYPHRHNTDGFFASIMKRKTD